MGIDVRLGRHFVGEAKQVLHAHVSADSHFVNKERFDFCDVQVLEKGTNKVGESEVLAPVHVFGKQNFVFGKKGTPQIHKRKAELVLRRSRPWWTHRSECEPFSASPFGHSQIIVYDLGRDFSCVEKRK